MFICLCNPFSDKKVREVLDQADGKCTVIEIYKACSGGETPNCGACIDIIADMVNEHNKSFKE